MNDNYTFFIENVWPQVPRDLKAQVYERYPNIRIGAEPSSLPLPRLPLWMVVGLTGTGKTTTIQHLDTMRQAGILSYNDDIPDRRELADLIIIPTAQVLSGHAVEPVFDREQRFAYTYKFAHEFEPGGSAAAYSWLHYCGNRSTPLLSDGLRGPGEIAYALEHFPQWSVIELWVDPIIRLQRLTDRSDKFDYVTNTTIDLSFLSTGQQTIVEEGLRAGTISPKAIITARAEALNYGIEPYDRTDSTAHYHCVVIDTLTPSEVAQQIKSIVEAEPIA